MLRRFSRTRIAFFFLLDWLGSLAVLAFAGLLRDRLGHLPEAWANVLRALHISIGGLTSPAGIVPLAALPAGALALVAAIWPISFLALSVYDGRRNATLGAELRHVLAAVCVATLALAGALFFTYREVSRLLMALFFTLDLALLLGARVALWAYRKMSAGRASMQQRPVLIVGAGEAGQRAAAQLAEYRWTGIDPVGYLDDDASKQEHELSGLPVLGTLDQAADVVSSCRVQEAVIALPLRAHQRMLHIGRTLQGLGVHVYVVPDLFALSFPGAALDGFGGIPVVDLGVPGLDGYRRASKRAFDVLVGACVAALLSPLLLLVAVLIRLDSPGPVIYRQTRLGERGRPFTLLKFRSMRVGNDSGAHQAHMAHLIQENLDVEQARAAGHASLKMEGDPRITRVGRTIRKLSIDELPQLWNVLRGEMSLVGPRPPLPYEVDLYQDWHRRRLEALPGLTGLWQIRGRNRVTFDEMVRMDIYYIEHQALWLDIKILLLTPWAALSARGAG